MWEGHVVIDSSSSSRSTRIIEITGRRAHEIIGSRSRRCIRCCLVFSHLSLCLRAFPLADLNPLPISFLNEDLHLSVGWIRRYYNLDKDWRCCYIVVKAVVSPSFLAMKVNRNSYLFQKINDRGKYLEACDRKHQHMFIFSSSENNFTQNVCKKIYVPRIDRSCNNIYCIRIRWIPSHMHLVNSTTCDWMDYVRKWQSRWNGAFKKKSDNVEEFTIIFGSSANFRLPTCLQWDGDIIKLIHQEYRFMEPEILARANLGKDAMSL